MDRGARRIQDGYAVKYVLVSRFTYIGTLSLSAATEMALSTLPLHKNRLTEGDEEATERVGESHATQMLLRLSASVKKN